MPDPWEYPWFARGTSPSTRSAWPTWTRRFAKYQLIALTREWFMHPNGALPAYEWAFDDVNPAGPRVGRVARVPDRRARIERSWPDLPQAAHQLHVVGQP
jgi:hypothetical protein